MQTRPSLKTHPFKVVSLITLRLLSILKYVLIPLLLLTVALAANKKPNSIIIFTYDQGCFGSPDIKTPNIDKMAAEGMKLTSFYAQTVFGPSRAPLLTGYYPLRNKRADDGVVPAFSEKTIDWMVGEKTATLDEKVLLVLSFTT